MDGAIFRLTEPVTAYGKTFTEISLREPTGALHMRLGPPRVAVTNFSGGSVYFVEQNEVIQEYLKALIDVGVDKEEAHLVPYVEGLLKNLSLTDSVRVREALFGFFDNAALRGAALKTAPKPHASSLSD